MTQNKKAWIWAWLWAVACGVVGFGGCAAPEPTQVLEEPKCVEETQSWVLPMGGEYSTGFLRSNFKNDAAFETLWHGYIAKCNEVHRLNAERENELERIDDRVSDLETKFGALKSCECERGCECEQSCCKGSSEDHAAPIRAERREAHPRPHGKQKAPIRDTPKCDVQPRGVDRACSYPGRIPNRFSLYPICILVAAASGPAGPEVALRPYPRFFVLDSRVRPGRCRPAAAQRDQARWRSLFCGVASVVGGPLFRLVAMAESRPGVGGA